MGKSTDFLKMRILLCFWKENGGTVTGISKTLGEEKYTVSRMLIALEQEGLVDRSDNRTPHLTERGAGLARRYEERIDTSLNHLLYEGVDPESARRDAFYWALYCSEQTMETIRATEARYRVKYDLRSRKQFGGSLLCRRLREGSYAFPFLMYRETVVNGSNLSMSNEGFEHPCTLIVRQGVGVIQLRALSLTARSASTGREMTGKIQTMKYLEGENFYAAEQSGDLFRFPASALQFVNVGNGVGQVLHGSVCLKMTCSAGLQHMPESTAIFTILI